MFGEARVQRVKVDILEGGLAPLAVGRVLAGAAFGLPDPLPVGGTVAGARKSIPLHEGFQQKDRMRVLALPVGPDLPDHPA